MIPMQSDVIEALRGKKCWYVSCGGSVGSSFELALGEKIPRRFPVNNPAHTEEFRQYGGESNLLVWCTWRLDTPTQPLSGSDASQKSIEQALSRLVGEHAVEVVITNPGWDLRMTFSNGLTLNVFCDHVGDEPSFSSNWELWQQTHGTIIGVDSVCTVEPTE